MDSSRYEEFKTRLDEELKDQLFAEEDTPISGGFNSGARTMYHAALSVFLRMVADDFERGLQK